MRQRGRIHAEREKDKSLCQILMDFKGDSYSISAVLMGVVSGVPYQFEK